LEFCHKIWHVKYFSENCMILTLPVLSQYTRVTDRRLTTDDDRRQKQTTSYANSGTCKGTLPQPLLVSENKTVFATSHRRPHDPVFIRLGTIPARNRRVGERADGFAIAIKRLALCCVS